MLIDNREDPKKADDTVAKWIKCYATSGKFDIVTGYITPGALAYLVRSETPEDANKSQYQISYRIVIGDVVNQATNEGRGLDILNGDISIQEAFQLRGNAQTAVQFLQRKNVELRTLEPNFVHAKTYLFHDALNRVNRNYYIVGSSNLTEAGIGLKKTSNVEVNVAGFTTHYDELTRWFEGLWNREQATNQKTIFLPDGKKRKISLKKYLINEISKICEEYTPYQIYQKVLFELFGKELLLEKDDPQLERKVGRLEETTVYKTLYEFQQKGVISLIKMLERYNGAILADAVGLGKTWSALAVMKFYQMQGYEIVLLCPKKLENNWNIYRKKRDSRFESDQLEYDIRFHTDLMEERMGKDEYREKRADAYFVNEKPKLFVIDESHNLRNDKSKRYQFLLHKILVKNAAAKVLLLSATPINNALIDIRNQFALMVQGKEDGFKRELKINHLTTLFRNAQRDFRRWTKSPTPRISEFIRMLPQEFFRLTDSLIVARTRHMVATDDGPLTFPYKNQPQNVFLTPRNIGSLRDFEDIEKAFPPKLSGYSPAMYIIQEENVPVIHDEQKRDYFLVKMMYILLAKRLESSWYSFYRTTLNVLAHHENALHKIQRYRKENIDVEAGEDVAENEEDIEILEDVDEAQELTLGKKRKIKLSDIAAAGNLTNYEKDLRADIEYLKTLRDNFAQFNEEIAMETTEQSRDDKLQKLMKIIREKQAAGKNGGNQKVLLFTVYTDTAFYLFDELRKRGFTRIAAVSGSGARIQNSNAGKGYDEEKKKFEPILQRFVPFTKLFREKEWHGFEPSSPNLSDTEKYVEWRRWIAQNDPETQWKLENEIDILIATDALSEGQNFQDCDTVINYDIHWNPVRIIQRMGRIDRIGSPNQEIFGVNFWPSQSINEYLNLQKRVQNRMAIGKLAGAEISHNLTPDLEEMLKDETLEQQQNEKMLRQMQDSWDDIETASQNVGLNDLSLEGFRQDLLEELTKDEKYYRDMPRGVFSGYVMLPEHCPRGGLIALLGHGKRAAGSDGNFYEEYKLLYIDENGESVFENQKEILDALQKHKDEARCVPEGLDQCHPKIVQKYQQLLQNWLEAQAKPAAGNLLSNLAIGGAAIAEAKKENISAKYEMGDFDLLAWFAVSESHPDKNDGDDATAQAAEIADEENSWFGAAERDGEHPTLF